MKKLLLAAVFLALMAGVSGAAQVVCPTIDTYAFYMASFGTKANGCTIDNMVFYRFTYFATAINAEPVLPGNILVVPVGGQSVDGFVFTGPWAVGSGATQDSVLLYNVGTIDGADLIIDNHLALVAAGFTGTGIARVDEGKCIGDEFPACTAGRLANLHVFTSAAGEKLVDEIRFAAVDTVGIIKDIVVVGGDDGNAAISVIFDVVTQVPEPSTGLMIGTGVVILLGAAWRRGKKAAEV